MAINFVASSNGFIYLLDLNVLKGLEVGLALPIWEIKVQLPCLRDDLKKFEVGAIKYPTKTVHVFVYVDFS